MEPQGAKVIPWQGRAVQERDESRDQLRFAPIEELLIVISDDQLDAQAAAYLMNPARRAMTFEAYLAVRGFARPVDD